MVNQSFPETENTELAKTDRSDLRVIFVFIFFSLLIVTSLAMMVWNHNKTAEKMTGSVKKHDEIIKTARACISNIGVAHRMILNLAIVTDSAERKRLVEQRTSSLQQNDLAFDTLQTSFRSEASYSSDLIAQIKESRAAYIQSGEQFLALTQQDDRNKISDFLLKDLRPKYEVYQDQQKQVYERLNTQLLQQTGEMTDSSNVLAWILFSIGILPFIYVLGKAVYFFFSTHAVL